MPYLLIAVDFGRVLRVEETQLSIAKVEEAPFLEYLDMEGIVHPNEILVMVIK